MEFEEPRAAACEVELLAHAHQTLSTTFVVGHFRPTRPVLLAGSRRLPASPSVLSHPPVIREKSQFCAQDDSLSLSFRS